MFSVLSKRMISKSKTLFLQQQSRRIFANSNVNSFCRRSYSTYFEQWQKLRRDQVNPNYVRGLISNLRDTNEFSKALQASEWMCEQKYFNVISEDYAARLYLIETVLGLEEAEKYFKRIPENMKDYDVYNTLLISYTKSVKTLDKAESTFKKMRDLGFLMEASELDSMISLYGQLSKQDMVKKLQKEKNRLRLEKIMVIITFGLIVWFLGDVLMQLFIWSMILSNPFSLLIYLIMKNWW